MVKLFILWRRHRARVVSRYTRQTVSAKWGTVTLGKFERGKEVKL